MSIAEPLPFMNSVALALGELFSEEVHELAEVLPDVAERVWQSWGQGRDASDLLDDLMGGDEHISDDMWQKWVAGIIGTTAGSKSEALQHLIGMYLKHLSATIQRAAVGRPRADGFPARRGAAQCRGRAAPVADALALLPGGRSLST